jgi:hypothetical protein
MVSLVVMQDPVHPSAPMANGNLVGSKEPQEGANTNHDVNGVNGANMPPQQVYVNPDMAELEHELRNMGMGPTVDAQGVETHGSGSGQDLDEDEGDNDEETNDEDPLKLFVGQVRLSIIIWRMQELGNCLFVTVGETVEGEQDCHHCLLSRVTACVPSRTET